ncbi:MAG: hypothetical protein E7265_06905 [Lachnospiraceae bacterium]|nr:hypothetical protein [Lachnospiraceae bacterium]
MSKAMRRIMIMTVTMLLSLVIMFGVGTKADAASKYKIRVNKQQNCVTIYRYEDGKYEPFKAMPCSSGWATPLGSFSLKEKIRWHELDGPVYGQYCTRITGHILFHSVWYYHNGNPATLSNTQYNKLGTTASHGCIRLCVGDVKWIYDNCPFGTPVEIYNSKNPGPLGKPAAIKLPNGWGWDPTDVTNPSNPYNKKKPVITLKTGKKKLIKVPFASNLDLMKMIKAKNTTGFDAIKLVKYKIILKEKGFEKTRKVKKVNTRKPGDYKVTYSLTDEIGRKASLSTTYRVETKIMMKSMKLNYDKKTLYLGGNKSQTTAKLKLKSCKPAKTSIKDLRYISDNPEIATVDKKGVIKAVAPGTTKIWAISTDGSALRKSCEITVKKYASSLTFASPKAEIMVGERIAATVALNPADATGGKKVSYTYVSSDSNIAVVDGAGNVTGMAPGTVVIYVTAANAAVDNGSLTSQITIVVKAPAVENPQNVSPQALNVN